MYTRMLPYLPSRSSSSSIVVDRRRMPSVELPPNCPRCDSSNTKFCYYNNYSLSQPRYFCKACRRYFTKGGSLRNIPVGGGCRKNRPPRTGNTTSAAGSSNSGGGCSPRQLQPDNNYPLRPDLLLDDPAAGSCSLSDGGSGGGGFSSAREQRPGAGADIDLALLYTKFLNQRPERIESGFPAPPGASVDEPRDQLDVVVDSDHLVAAVTDLHRPPELMMAAENQLISGDHLPSTGDDYSSFYLDPAAFCLPQMPSGEEILGSDAFWSGYGAVPAGWTRAQQAQSPGMGSTVAEKEHLQPQPKYPSVSSWNSNFSLASWEEAFSQDLTKTIY